MIDEVLAGCYSSSGYGSTSVGVCLPVTSGGMVGGPSGDVRGRQELVSALGGEIREREILVELPEDVLFAFDRSDLQPASEPTLRRLGELIGRTTGVAKVNGHTDAKGADAHKLALSTRRAEAIVAWLSARGIDPKRLVASRLGEQRPVSSNTMPDGRDDPAGRARNRRVEVVIRRWPRGSNDDAALRRLQDHAAVNRRPRASDAAANAASR